MTCDTVKLTYTVQAHLLDWSRVLEPLKQHRLNLRHLTFMQSLSHPTVAYLTLQVDASSKHAYQALTELRTYLDETINEVETQTPPPSQAGDSVMTHVPPRAEA